MSADLRPSDEQVEEWARGAEKVLADELPAGSRLWKAWALDLADQVVALAKRPAPSDRLVAALADLYVRSGGLPTAEELCDAIDPSGALMEVVRVEARKKMM